MMWIRAPPNRCIFSDETVDLTINERAEAYASALIIWLYRKSLYEKNRFRGHYTSLWAAFSFLADIGFLIPENQLVNIGKLINVSRGIQFSHSCLLSYDFPYSIRHDMKTCKGMTRQKSVNFFIQFGNGKMLYIC